MSNIFGKLFGIAIVASGVVILHDLSLRKTPLPLPIPIPEDCGQTFNCQSSWLSQVFGFDLDSFTLKNLGGGFTSQSYRLSFNNASSEKSESQPKSAVVKYSNPADITNWLLRIMFWRLGGVEALATQEVYFYKHMREKLGDIGVKTPSLYYAGIEDHGKRNILLYIMGFTSNFRALLVMEDLCEHKVFGLGKPLPLDYAVAAGRNLATLHRSYWDDNIKALSVDKLSAPLVYPALFTCNRWTRFPQSKQEIRNRFKNWAQSHPIFQDLKVQTLFENFVEIYPKLLKYFTNDKLTSGPLFKHHTFLHGDYHSGNMFFVTQPSSTDQPQIKDVILIDWQGYGIGHPSTELAYLLTFCEQGREHDDRIMQSYYEALTQKIPKESYPYQVMVREVEIRILGMGVSTFNYFRDTPETVKKNSQKMSRNGIVVEDMFKQSFSTIVRMANILEKWEKENLYHNLIESLEQF